MSDIDYRQFITNFCNRTDKNRKIIENEHKNDPESEAYEFTQLINSLFGLIIVPYERFRYRQDRFNKVTETKLADTIEGGLLIEEIGKLKKLHKIKNEGYSEKYPICYFVGHIRNSLAHMGDYGTLFIGDGKELVGVIFFDHEDNKKYCIELDIDSLKRIVQLITDMYLQFDDLSEEKSQEYRNKVTELQAFLSSK